MSTTANNYTTLEKTALNMLLGPRRNGVLTLGHQVTSHPWWDGLHHTHQATRLGRPSCSPCEADIHIKGISKPYEQAAQAPTLLTTIASLPLLSSHLLPHGMSVLNRRKKPKLDLSQGQLNIRVQAKTGQRLLYSPIPRAALKDNSERESSQWTELWMAHTPCLRGIKNCQCPGSINFLHFSRMSWVVYVTCLQI